MKKGEDISKISDKKMLRLIIFDFDGVLANSNEAHIEVVLQVLRKLGVDNISRNEITKHFGKPYKDVLKALVPDTISESELKKAAEFQLKILRSKEFISKLRLFPSVKRTLAKLRARGMKLAIATGNDEKFMNLALKQLSIEEFFDVVVTVDHVNRPKPYPDMILKILETLAIKANEALYVGDSINDVLMAKNSKVRSAVVLTGNLSLEEAKALKPDFIIDNVCDLLHLLKNFLNSNTN